MLVAMQVDDLPPVIAKSICFTHLSELCFNFSRHF